MTEAHEIAVNMLARAGGVPDVRSMDQARDWVKAQWPDWADWIGHQQLDNISEGILRTSEHVLSIFSAEA